MAARCHRPGGRLGVRASYLTDLVVALAVAGGGVRASSRRTPDDAIGINDRVALATAEGAWAAGSPSATCATASPIVDPSTTRIDATVEIGQDARIEPWTILEGATVVAQDAVIGPNAHLRDSRIGPRATVWAERGRGVDGRRGRRDRTVRAPAAGIADRAALPDRQLRRDRRAGLGAGTQQHHFSYLGDAEIGENVNVGAGSVTANFDGTGSTARTSADGASIGVDT